MKMEQQFSAHNCHTRLGTKSKIMKTQVFKHIISDFEMPGPYILTCSTHRPSAGRTDQPQTETGFGNQRTGTPDLHSGDRGSELSTDSGSRF